MDLSDTQQSIAGRIQCEDANGIRELTFSGAFTRNAAIAPIAEVFGEATAGMRQVRLIDQGIERWDSLLLTAIMWIHARCKDDNLDLDLSGMPEGVRRLYHLATVVSERKDARRMERQVPFVRHIGTRMLRTWRDGVQFLAFLGEAVISLGRFMVGRARYRPAEFWLIVQQCGPEALGIVTVISLLVGAILAFVGAIQLKMFGAEIYVADLVSIGMVVEMGALMTGIILAGRTGAAYAAQLGSMQVNEEIDALKTMGIPPMDYLVLPRMVALALMTPLLVIYADILGILGGAGVAIFALGISPVLFFTQGFSSMTLWFCAQGLIKGSTFGILIAISGCLKGMQCGRSASSVGDAATDAVVMAIVLIVIADAAWTYVFMTIG